MEVARRIAVVLDALRWGPCTVQELIRLPAYTHLNDPKARAALAATDLQRLMRDGRVERQWRGGHQRGYAYYLAVRPGDGPRPPVGDGTWTLEELLYWLSSGEGLDVRADEVGRLKAVAAVRAAIAARDRAAPPAQDGTTDRVMAGPGDGARPGHYPGGRPG
ncbi:MAG TPA: hypothetical protein VM597_30285 [Gemmataceae bacterium]|jgi:hypothetical protein|nr:hypothetical protein [Gemmataceae bacterium]